MRSRAAAALGLALAFAQPAQAQGEPFAPYGESRASSLLSWHPIRREMLIRQRIDGDERALHVSEPGAKPAAVAALPDRMSDASYQPTTGSYFVLPRVTAADGSRQLVRLDPATRAVTAITPESWSVDAISWNRKGDRLLVTTFSPGRGNPPRARTTLYLMDPLKPEGTRALAMLDGPGWKDFAFSEDDKQVVFTQCAAPSDCHLWLLDVATAKRRRFTRSAKSEPVHYGPARFLKDGKSVLVASDRGSDFRRLTQITTADGKEYPLTSRHAHDVDEFAISFDANRIAFTTNENGSHVLRFLDLATKRELTRPPLFDGVISALEWRRKSDELAFNVSSARTAGDVFSYDVKGNKLARWTNGNNPAINTSELVEPRLVKWKSFDELELTAFHYHPPAKFTGPRPVFVNLPDAGKQAMAGFIGRNNYYVNDLGIAMIHPNLRGAPGFGKALLKRASPADTARDLEALLAWIRTQPEFDAERIFVGTSGANDPPEAFAGGLELAKARLLK